MPQRTRPTDERMTTALAAAKEQAWVLSRKELYGLGITRWEITGQVRAGRWQLLGDQSVCLHNGEVSDDSHRWAAVIQGGPRACLDGASALIASGLERFTVDRHRVSVPRGARVRRTRLYDIRQTRRLREADRSASGIPRTRPPVAAIRGALWATTDKQASYLLTLTVQQGLATPEQLGMELLRIKRHRRLRLLHAVVNDLIGGARSVGELELATELRRRGLPVPERQVLRHDGTGRYFLDLYWPDHRLVVEIDGIHHTWAQNVVADALRQNTLMLQGDTVLRLPLLGLRLEPDRFFGQIAAALARPVAA